MEDHDYHQIYIKIGHGKYAIREIHDSSMKEKGNHLIDINIKLEPAETKKADQNNGTLSFGHECKLEMDIEAYDEFYNAEAKSIYFEDFNRSMVKSEKVAEVTSQSATNSDIQTEGPDYTSLWHKCDKCNYVAKSKFAIKYHQLEHTKVRQFKCDKCSYRAKTKYVLFQHQMIHTKIMPFKCHKCSYQTRRKATLRFHELEHEGIFPNFSCADCDYVTKYKGNLSKHQVVHHPDKIPKNMLNLHQDKNFKCDKCNYVAKYKRVIKVHQLKHTNVRPFKCDKCSYRGKTKYVLSQHQMTHKKIIPYKCHTCSFQTRSKYVLRSHELEHEGIFQNLSCADCDYVTKYKGKLSKHQLAHHLDKKVKSPKKNIGDFKSKNNKIPKITQKSLDGANVAKYHKSILNHKFYHQKSQNFSDKCNYESNVERHFDIHQEISQLDKTKVFFSCTTCDYATNHLESIWKHQLIHFDLDYILNIRRNIENSK